MNIQKLFVACDHGGLDLKRHLMARLPDLPWEDLGAHAPDSVDYPDYAKLLCERLQPALPDAAGVLICGSGQGMAIRANRFPFIRAALCWNVEIAELSRAHNDANVLCLGGRVISFQSAESILLKFINTSFEGGRHQRRVEKLGC